MVGILVAGAIIGGAVWALWWTGGQSLAGLSIELILGAVFLDWLFLKRPIRRSGRSNSGYGRSQDGSA